MAVAAIVALLHVMLLTVGIYALVGFEVTPDSVIGFIGAVAVAHSGREEREWGKDRAYDLPLRVCPGCRPRLANPEERTRTLRLVPLYADLITIVNRVRARADAR